MTRWSASPALQVGNPPHADQYRLQNGQLAFRPATTRKWRVLSYPEIKHHMLLNTPIGRWLARLHARAKLAEFLGS